MMNSVFYAFRSARTLQRSMLATILCASVSSTVIAAESVNVYSYRQPFLIDPIFEAFTAETGIKVNTVFAKKGLIERLKNEGVYSKADLILTSDFANLRNAVDAGVTQPVQNEQIESNIPSHFRDQQGNWFGLTTRARLIVYSHERMSEPDAPSSYEALADPKYKGKLCTRSGKHNYMVALIASLNAHQGEAATKQWLEDVKNNLARKPQGNDRAQVKAIKQGECDIAIINSYYIGAMLADAEQTEWANAVKVVFPNQANRGTHMNISGMAMTSSAPNKQNAIKLMEFLTSAQAQSLYAELNHEYPISPEVAASQLVQSWGTFDYDQLPLNDIVDNLLNASKLVDEVGYDN